MGWMNRDLTLVAVTKVRNLTAASRMQVQGYEDLSINVTEFSVLTPAHRLLPALSWRPRHAISNYGYGRYLRKPPPTHRFALRLLAVVSSQPFPDTADMMNMPGPAHLIH